MAHPSELVSEPIPISLIAGRYLLFDVNVVTYLRRTHHICGSLIGGIPQAPQQNVFMGLPLELMPEEAKLLVEKEVAYVVNDTAWHKERFNTFQGADREHYLGSLRAEGLKARNAAQASARQKSERALGTEAVRNALKAAAAKKRAASSEPSSSDLLGADDTNISLNHTPNIPDDAEEPSLFGDERPESPSGSAVESSKPYAITPTTSYATSSLPQNPTQQPDPPVPSSYALFKHLHSKGYYAMPGLRFGCNYNVYPGDPLRFHSHFLATSFEYEEEIPLLDLVGGGRLGTAVKKGFLIGGENKNQEPEAAPPRVRTFCIEWGGM